MDIDMTASVNTAGPAAFAPLTFDPRAFMHYVEDEDLSEAEATQLLRAIWDIVMAFVDLGYGIHPVQQAVDRFDGTANRTAIRPETVLDLSQPFSSIANQQTDDRARREATAKEDS